MFNMAKKKRLPESSSSSSSGSGIMHLPEDVFVNILTRLPLETLGVNLIFVCKTWATIILRNPILITRHGEPALFLQEKTDSSTRRTLFLEFKEGKFKLRNYKFKFSQGQLLGSSGGVALFYNFIPADPPCMTIHVANPFTRYVMQLPPCDALRSISIFGSCINIGVIPRSGIVKVVISGRDFKGKFIYWEVLTVGVDMSWRRITSTLQEPKDHHLYNQKLISVGGVMYSKFHLKRNWCFESRDLYIHAIDLRDETTRYFQVPKELGDGISWLMEMGEHLCCIVQENRTVHNVWILKDLNQNAWVKLYRIDVNFKENIGNHFPEPIGWMDNNQSLVFSVCKRIHATTSVIVAYNVTTGKKITCRKVDPSLFKVQLHKNTLLSFFKGT